MAFEQDPNSGALFRNNRKSKDSDPVYTGSAKIGDNINGKEYWVSAWVNTSRSGDKYMSLKFTEKQSRTEQKSQAEVDFDSDLPF